MRNQIYSDSVVNISEAEGNLSILPVEAGGIWEVDDTLASAQQALLVTCSSKNNEVISTKL